MTMDDILTPSERWLGRFPDNSVCRRCGKPIEGKDWVEHHLSYQENHTIPMHRSCHTALHQEIRRTDRRGFLRPVDCKGCE